MFSYILPLIKLICQIFDKCLQNSAYRIVPIFNYSVLSEYSADIGFGRTLEGRWTNDIAAGRGRPPRSGHGPTGVGREMWLIYVIIGHRN